MNTKRYLRTDVFEIFTNYIYNLMKSGENFVLFLNNRQILNDTQYQEWIKENGIINDTQRIIYHKCSDGYVITKSDCMLNLTVPNDLLKMEYVEFMDTI